MKKLLILFFLLMCVPAFSAPTSTLSISPSATDGTTITASDENTRNNATTTWANAHDHDDIDTTANTLKVGDATTGNKTIQANNADSNKPYIRYDDSNDKWVLSLDGSNQTNFITLSGAASGSWTAIPSALGPNRSGETLIYSGSSLAFGGMGRIGQMEYHNGTVRVPLEAPDKGKMLSFNGTIPFWSGINQATGSFNIVLSSSSGTQTSVTGVGFRPSSVMFFGIGSQTDEYDFQGFNTQSGTAVCKYEVGDGSVTAHAFDLDTSNSLHFEEDTASKRFTGIISQFHEDGFVITWTKTNSPTGTGSVLWVAFK